MHPGQVIYHQPVFLKAILQTILRPSDKYVVDGTLGEGGHSEAFLTAGKQVIGIDRDEAILQRAQQRLHAHAFRETFTCLRGNFKDMDTLLPTHHAKIDLILLDLGISQFHYFASHRGFSFQNHEPLDMRLDAPIADPTVDPTVDPTIDPTIDTTLSTAVAAAPLNHLKSPQPLLSAADILAAYSQAELTEIFRRYGEENHAARYAAAIIDKRDAGEEIIHSDALAACISDAAPGHLRHRRIHPATKVFQALRIYVNKEGSALKQGILAGLPLLASEGRFAIITYHSLEDRIVKNLFKALTQSNDNTNGYLNPGEGLSAKRDLHPPLSHVHPRDLPQRTSSSRKHALLQGIEAKSDLKNWTYQLLTKKVIKPSREEILDNRSARSAKLRILVKTRRDT